VASPVREILKAEKIKRKSKLINLKVNFTLEEATKAQSVSRGIALLFP
jgi:hypothetical protein